ncbi:MAG: EamA family transporter [Peptoniphilaceae bacterium]|nr:EamA family transporter [Peptoniphilaceae bacterium]MDY3076365.1 EamA family transporter [Peptoniphilaceae bacterium]MDY3987256.1 EamA family transporter [Peptoniphilaceae bacterium]MDY5841414.1 EamA family transporter [Peptoniphilaceae bacterium]
MFWILYAFGSAFFAGVTAILSKIGLNQIPSTLATAIRTGVVLIFSWLLVFLTGAQNSIQDVHGATLVFLILSGLTTGISWLCYFRALQLGEVSRVASIDKSSTVMTILLSFLILREPISWMRLLGMTGIGAGTIWMVSRSPSEDKNPERGWAYYAIASAFFASLTSIFGKIGIENVDSNLGTAIRTVVVLVMAWAMVLIKGEQEQIRGIDRKAGAFLLLSGIATGFSWLCFYKALQTGVVAAVVPIDKLSILVTILFSRWLFKEKLSRKAFLGLMLIVAGTGLMIF